jgi:putative ABC transport system permease protein
MERFWELLLSAYPADFRDEYGPEMLQTLQDRYLEERGVSRLRFCIAASMNVLTTASKEWQDVMLQDFVHSWRRVAAHPGVAAIAILSLALGIGANTTMFSIVYASLLRPLPFPDSDRRMVVSATALNSSNRMRSGVAATADFVDWRQRSSTLEDWHMFTGVQPNTITGIGLPERITTQNVTVGFLESLGVRPVIGTLFPLDSEQQGEGIALISEAFWERRFGREPNILGRSITVSGHTGTIIGVLPAQFHIFDESFPVDVWTVIDLTPGSIWIQRKMPWVFATARLKPGVSVERAQSEMTAMAAALAQTYPDTNRNRGTAVVPMLEARNGSLGSILYPLFGAVGFVLLIGCTNVANLLLARASARRREISVRAAMGASRGRLVRELLADGFVLAIPGLLVGLGIALAGMTLFRAFVPQGYPGALAVTLNLPALFFSAGTGALAGLLSAIFPALESSQVDLTESLKEGGRGSAGRKQQRLRSFLVAGEIALALVLLAGAGLTLNSLLRMQNHSPGFDFRNVTVARFDLRGKRYMTDAPQRDMDMRYVEPATRRFLEHMLEQARGLPNVESAAFGANVPMGASESPGVRVRLPKQMQSDAELRSSQFNTIAGEFFQTLHIPLRRGRYLNERDNESAPWVAVVNETFAREFFPNADAVGQVITLLAGPEEQPRQIVGVVADYTQFSPRFPTRPEVFTSHFQQPREIPGNFQGPRFRSKLLLKTKGEAPKLDTISRIVADFDKDLPVIEMKPLDWYIAQRGGDIRFYARALGVFALIALVLAAIGIYGLMSYSVTERIHEIGIRLSLGATRARIVWLVVSHGLKLAALGLLAGIAGALATSRLLTSILFGVAPWDPATLLIVASFLMVVALLACAIPAWRATHVDAAIALRRE